jgi:hypothetical protein
LDRLAEKAGEIWGNRDAHKIITFLSLHNIIPLLLRNLWIYILL